tara:strand:+ start:469 stop:1041 length:573 start_codon:yes stop_codon:yes gene_type:complete
MVIHKSHTKKDLIELIDVFGFQDFIDNYKELNKDALTALLSIHLRTIEGIKPNREYYDFEDINDLQEYLKNPSPKQVLTIKEKDIIIDKAKKIIFYCRIAGYCLGSTTYESYDEIIKDAKDIRKYGDIPTIRRALKLLKDDLNIEENIDPIMTYRMQQRLERKDRIRANGMARMTKSIKPKGGMFVLKFD